MADIRNQTPISSKASAGGKGHNGAALATVFINETETAAREMVRQAESMKSRLKKLTALTAEDHVEFRATMAAKLEDLKGQAEAAKLSLNDYCKQDNKAGQIAAVVRTSVSLWMKLSTACQAGFTPDYGMAWANISKAATEYKSSTGSPDGKQATAGRKPTPVLDKTKNFVKGNMLDDAGKVKPELIQKTDTGIPLIESIMMMVMMADAPDELVDELVGKLQQFKKDRTASREAAAKAAAKASKTSKEATTAEPTGNPGETLVERGKAAAKASKSRKNAETAPM